MAALTSSQSGNFNSSSTWGGTTPADGDTFTISAGHEVVVNSDIRTTNGYGDITVRGHLKFETNAKMRLNGRITVKGYNSAAYNVSGGAWFTKGNSATAGLFSSSGNNMILEVRGNNSDQHGIWVENERFASMKLYADEKRTTTTNSSAIGLDDGYVTVSDASGFAQGDWVSVFKEDEDNYVIGDECFFVHDVDTTANRIYVRQFVSPSSTIEDITGDTVKVSNSKVFRKGYWIIVGTGSNRKIAKINSINYARDTFVTSVNIPSGNVGETVYQTGAEKIHAASKKVQKIATTLTTAITTVDSTNQITVGSADDIEVGDTIIIDANNDNDFNWNYDVEYSVTAKSGTTLTLDDQVRHKHKEGSIIQILDRHFTIKGVDNSSDTRPFLYVEYWTDYNNAHTRQIGLRNIRFTQWGYNTNSTYYRGVMIAGYNSEKREGSSDNRYQYQSHAQGCVVDNCNNAYQSYTGLTFRHPYGATCRNNVGYHVGNQPLWGWSSQYNIKYFGNYTTRSSYSSFQIDAMYDYSCAIEYNYGSRSDDYGLMLHHNRGNNPPIRHNILINHENRPFYCYYFTNDTTMERIYFDGFNSLPHIGSGNGTVQWLDCYMDNRWYKSIVDETNGVKDANRYIAYASADGNGRYWAQSGKLQHFVSYEHNFHYDAVLESFGGGANYKDSSLRGNMKIYTLQGNDYTPVVKTVYVPAATVARISCEMLLSKNSHTRPKLYAAKSNGYRRSGGRYIADSTDGTTHASDHADSGGYYGFSQHIQYTSSAQGSWEEKQLTIAAQDKGYFLQVGISTHDDNRDEVHYAKEINIFLESSSAISKSDTMGKKPSVRSSFNRAKKRIGGTRL